MGSLIRFFSVFLFLFSNYSIISGQSYLSYITGNAVDKKVDPMPAIILAGGGTDNDDAMKWMLSRANGGDVLVLRASGSDGYNDYFYTELGVKINSVESIVFSDKSAASEPYILNKIKNAEVIFIAGGDQTRYFDYWNGTEVGNLLKTYCKDRSKIIGGTSAGMMILGNIVYAPLNDGVTSAQALANPYHPNMTNIKYDSFLQTQIFSNCIFDTHFDNRDRSGRLMVFLARASVDKNIRAKAIACNESTAICIDEMNIATVFGDAPNYPDFAYFLEVNCEEEWKPQTIETGKPLNWKTINENAVIVQRINGNKVGTAKFDLNTWKIVSNGGGIENWQIEDGKLNKSNTVSSVCRTTLTDTQDMTIIRRVPFPNPTDSILYFSISDSSKLISSDGKIINSCQHCNQMDVSNISFGEYILVLTTADQTISHKVSIVSVK